MSNLEKFKKMEREATPFPWICISTDACELSDIWITNCDLMTEADKKLCLELRNAAPKLIRLWEAATKLCCRNQFCRAGSWCDLCLAKMELDQNEEKPRPRATKEVEVEQP